MAQKNHETDKAKEFLKKSWKAVKGTGIAVLALSAVGALGTGEPEQTAEWGKFFACGGAAVALGVGDKLLKAAVGYMKDQKEKREITQANQKAPFEIRRLNTGR